MKRIISLLLALTLLLGVMPTAFAAETGYKVTFAADEHATVDVYNTQNYTTPSSTNVTAAVARDSDSGEIDISPRP